MRNKRGYQYNFSDILPEEMYSKQGRERKAKTMLAVFKDFLQKDMSNLSVLDIGSSTGIISNYIAPFFGKVYGIDIDGTAVEFAQKNRNKSNTEFILNDSMNICFRENVFDVIICAHIYEHVPDAVRLMNEIYRILKPGGVCYFAAGNRLNINEAHYHLPFLSVIPKPLAHIYFRLCGKGELYYEEHLTYWGLKKIVQKFSVIDYTKKIVQHPDRFHADYMITSGTLKAKLANIIVQYAYSLFPTYIWVLKKA